MFQKPFRMKSHTAIKGSDRKKLRNDISQQFPLLSADELSNFVPSKSDLSVMKLYTHGDDQVLVYISQKTPIFFELEKTLYPTVYTLWKIPNLLHTFTTWPPVFDKLSSGADLMLPGFVLEGELGPHSYGKLKKGDVCAVNLTNNRAPIAVGKAALSSSDMFMSGKRGKGVLIMHTYMDLLWATGEKTHPPILVPLNETVDDDGAEQSAETNESATENDELITDLNNLNVNDDNDENVQVLEAESCVAEVEVVKSPVEQMDDLLLNCFLYAWKTTGKKVELPLLTSTFYKAHIIPACPRGANLDVKKSSHKKLSKFLQVMQERGIIEVKELSKGVESIVQVNLSHPDLRACKLPDKEDEDEDSNQLETTGVSLPEMKYEFPEVTEMHSVTADVLPLFRSDHVSKGATLTASEIRAVLRNYVKNNELQNEMQKSLLNTDETMRATLKCQQVSMRWDELMERCIGRMKPAYQIKFPNQVPVTKKGQLESIELSVCQRAANKKVTLINNLETYGIDPNAFSHAVQIGVAASSSVYPAANRKDGGHEVLVQGNQVKFIAKMLLDDYKVPRKYIKGLELAPKPGKKK